VSCEATQRSVNSPLSSSRQIIEIQRRDQYQRVVAHAYVPRLLGHWWWENVSLALVRVGLASVYDGSDAAYGGIERQLRAAMAKAKRKRVGLWSQETVVSPEAFKASAKAAAAAVAGGGDAKVASPPLLKK
jgi:endonuclease YncB( thermonuclease family)